MKKSLDLYTIFVVYSSMKMMIILIGLLIYVTIGYNYVRGYERKYDERVAGRKIRIIAVH